MIMRMHARRLSVLPAIAALVCGYFAAGAAEQVPERVKAQTVSLGLVSEINQTLIADHFSDFVRYVAGKLSSASDIEGKVVIASTPFQLARLIEQKKVDFYMESPYPTYLVNDVQGVARLMLRRWKGGMAEYRSLIFTKKNGEINRLEDGRDSSSSTKADLTPMLRRRTSVISLPALKKKSSIGCSPKRRRLEPSVTTTTRDLTRRKDRTSSSWQKQSDSHATWSPSERIFLLRWPTALRRYCSRCTKTTKGEKS